MAIKYVFKEDSFLSIKNAGKANAQVLGEALEAISAKAGGHLMPASVVDAARDRKNPLHKHFEWDNAVAAEAYRLDQARGLIRCIHVQSDDTESGYARAFLSIREQDGVSYRSVDDVMSSADLQQRVLAQAERDLIAFETRYRSLNDICDLVRQARERLAVRRSAGSDNRTVS